MDRLNYLALQLQCNRLSIEAFRQRAVEAIETMSADDLMQIALMFDDEMEDEPTELTEIIKP